MNEFLQIMAGPIPGTHAQKPTAEAPYKAEKKPKKPRDIVDGLALLKSLGGKATSQQLIKKSKLSPSAVSQKMMDLHRRGKVIRENGLVGTTTTWSIVK